MRMLAHRAPIRRLPALITGLLLLGACADEPPTSPEAAAPAFTLGPVEATTADVIRIAAPNDVVGHSMIKRNRNGITAQLETTVVPAGHAVTIWAVYDNMPGMDGGTGVARLAGRVVGGGVAHFADRLRAGATKDLLRGVPLTNPLGAEITLIVRTHGPPIPGQVDDQIHTVGGGCDMFPCEDLARAVHMPPAH